MTFCDVFLQTRHSDIPNSNFPDAASVQSQSWTPSLRISDLCEDLWCTLPGTRVDVRLISVMDKWTSLCSRRAIPYSNSRFLSIAHQAVSGLLVLSIHVCFPLQKGHTLCAKTRCKHMNTDKHKTHEMMTIGSTYKPLQTFSCSPQKKQRALLVVPNSAANSTAIVLSSWSGKGNTGTSDSYI